MLGTFVLVFLFIFYLYKHQVAIWKQRKKFHEEEINHQKKLSKAIVDTQEEERQRIGMDLHDDIGAMLATLRLRADYLISDDSTTVNHKKEIIKGIIDQISGDVRKLSHRLSPDILTFYSLGEAIEVLFDGISTQQFKADYHENELSMLNGFNINDSIAIYRIVEELIQNTIKHANATSCEIKVSRNATDITILYLDNGTGIKAQSALKKGIGMKNIYTRIELMNGHFFLNNSSPAGFNFEFSVPNAY